MISKKITIILGIIIILTICLFFLLIIYSTDIAPYSNFYVKKTEVKDNSITISGYFLSSGLVYKGYEYEIKNNALYFSIKQGFPTKEFASGDFYIKINEDFSKIEYIYIRDSKESTLLWEK